MSTAPKAPVNLAPARPPTKQCVALRLDRDVVAWFRSHAPHYQVAMREVLRAYVREQGGK